MTTERTPISLQDFLTLAMKLRREAKPAYQAAHPDLTPEEVNLACSNDVTASLFERYCIERPAYNPDGPGVQVVGMVGDPGTAHGTIH